MPSQRANLNWLLRRSYRLGQTYVLSEIARLRGVPRFARATQLGLRALLQLLVAAGVTLASLPFFPASWLSAGCAPRWRNAAS